MTRVLVAPPTVRIAMVIYLRVLTIQWICICRHLCTCAERHWTTSPRGHDADTEDRPYPALLNIDKVDPSSRHEDCGFRSMSDRTGRLGLGPVAPNTGEERTFCFSRRPDCFAFT